MKTAIVFIVLALCQMAGAKQTYGIHLFFNESEFIDVLVLEKPHGGKIIGEMHVPNDFDGPLENLTIENNRIVFDLLVPKNSSRPKDLIFHYEGQFFTADQQQIIGFVTLKGQPEFIASFTGFLRKE